MADFQDILAAHGLPVRDLITEIADERNISESFDYVVSHLECKEQREHIRPKKAQYCKALKRLLSDGSFRITEEDFRTIEVRDGIKDRICQAPTVFHRVGCHAVMVPFEAHTYPSLIKNTAASIKERGMHWLHDIIEADLAADPDGMTHYYQCDIHHYYDSILQETMKRQTRQYTTDPVALPMLDNFITLLPEGLSKGLRASQCLANLQLNEIDHKMCERVSYHEVDDEGGGVAIIGKGAIIINGKEIRFHYYRYCDDIVMFAATKQELWRLRDYLVSLLAELKLEIKPNEAVRPISSGLDYLGYTTFMIITPKGAEVYSRIRKRTKQKFARRITRVKSRKRRQSLIGSFFGMAAHADCRHLLKSLITQNEFNKLKHKRKMKDFGTFQIKPTTFDGKKNFKGNKINCQEIDRKGVIVVDYEKDVIPKREREDYTRRLQAAALQGIDTALVEKPKTRYLIQIICDNMLRKLWTADREIWGILDQLNPETDFPFFVYVTIDYSGQYRKINFNNPAAHGITPPTDEQLAMLERQLNVKLLKQD